MAIKFTTQIVPPCLVSHPLHSPGSANGRVPKYMAKKPIMPFVDAVSSISVVASSGLLATHY